MEDSEEGGGPVETAKEAVADVARAAKEGVQEIREGLQGLGEGGGAIETAKEIARDAPKNVGEAVREEIEDIREQVKGEG